LLTAKACRRSFDQGLFGEGLGPERWIIVENTSFALPLPLAQLYTRAFNAKDARSRHDNAFYLFEATIKLAAAPAVACYVHDVRSGSTRVPELDRLLLQLALPSLGQLLRDTLDAGNDRLRRE
jgi:hypothetical protein